MTSKWEPQGYVERYPDGEDGSRRSAVWHGDRDCKWILSGNVVSPLVGYLDRFKHDHPRDAAFSDDDTDWSKVRPMQHRQSCGKDAENTIPGPGGGSVGAASAGLPTLGKRKR